MKVLFVGPLWDGSTAFQRLDAFRAVEGTEVLGLDSREGVGKPLFIDRVLHRLGRPRDKGRLNERLLATVHEFSPELIFVDSTRMLTPATLRHTREVSGAPVVFYSPDDMSARHNSSRQLEACDSEWDIFFTTKTFNVPELRARGVRYPMLVGNAFDPKTHHPLTKDEVGADFERFDAVFVGTREEARERSMNSLAEAGVSVAIYGNGWSAARLHPSITLGPAAYAGEYTRVLHTGKLALCFLRKLNRDKVTQRSTEVPASGRPMVAEKTEEHDEMFEDGVEYISFSNDAELIARVRDLLNDNAARRAVGEAGRRRCLDSGYSVVDRAREMLAAVNAIS